MMEMKKKIKFIAAAVFFALSSSGFALGKSAVELYDEGLTEENNEQWYMASQKYMEAVQLNPVYADAWFHLAKCSYQLGEYELVLSQLEEAQKYAKNESSIFNLRGMTFIALERFADARKVFEDVLRSYPNNVDARFGLAELDLFDGRVTGAEKMYMEALSRQRDNRKALLSLAVVSCELGKTDLARKYVTQALGYYSGECEVHYLAAVIYAMQNDLDAAEKHVRIALEINGDYDKAYDFLAKIRFAKGFYPEVISICDFRIGRNRELSSAWYLKGLSQCAENEIDAAINTWSGGLDVDPSDEIMRSALESLVSKYVPLEDGRRKAWADYHVQEARECSRRYDSTGATFQYQQALKINPSNEEARKAYADMLELNGMHELYLDQLLFLRERIISDDTSDAIISAGESFSAQNEQKKDFEQQQMDYTIEAYDSLLKDSLANKWNVQPFYLDKTRWKLGVYYTPSTVSQPHPQNNRVSAEFASEIFSGIAYASVCTYAEPVAGFGEAYQKARSSKTDYFVIISFDEGSRDVTLDFAMYSGRSGYKIHSDSYYATGNNRYSNIFRRFRKAILERLPVRGKILNREGKRLLVDMGKSENLVNGALFDVVKKGSIETSGSSGGIVYKESDVLGNLTITTVGEEVSEGLLEYDGFYDKVNTGDEIVLLSMPKPDEMQSMEQSAEITVVSDTAPTADVNGNAINQPKSMKVTAAEFVDKRTPSFIDLIRSIY